MADATLPDPPSVTSVAELSVGDAIYAEASDSPYWVAAITDEKVRLLDAADRPHEWYRETFERSLSAHTWVYQGPRR